jgi:hypothetical protein
MPTYTVHAPPPREGQSADPGRFVFVRDGFHFWAFLLAPLWMLARRLWLVFVLYIALDILLGIALKLTNAGPFVGSVTGFAVALIVGLEAATLRRWTFARRGWRMLGFVVGEDKEAAERRFFGEWVRRATTPPPLPEPAYAAPVRRGPPSSTDVIGLFPEPGGAP